MATVTAQSIRDLAIEQGFSLCGITLAEPSAHADHFRAWLNSGQHGEMDYLARNVETRLDPRKLLPDAASVIMIADRHPTVAENPSFPGAGAGVARYAWYGDYHKHMKKRLFDMADTLREVTPEHQFRVTVDTAPLLEREHAARAGLGWIGKHTLLIHPRKGSYFLLGAIVTTLRIAPDHQIESDHCGSCTRCIDACPTDCITPYSVDASRCISYLTLEHRTAIDPELHEPMGHWIAGCDICQEVCPYNAEQRVEPSPKPTHQPALALEDVLDWDVAARQEALRGSALKRIKLDMWKRNALIAAGNHLRENDDVDLLDRIKAIADDADEPDMVRQTAIEVLTRLGTRRSE